MLYISFISEKTVSFEIDKGSQTRAVTRDREPHLVTSVLYIVLQPALVSVKAGDWGQSNVRM